MIKSNFQLEKEKERSILDCITSITGKLNEATVVGFSAPMGGIAGAQPSWATQRAKALTNPALPPLQPGQSRPFVVKGPFVGEPQGQQTQQSQPQQPQPQQSQSAQYQTAMAGTVPASALPTGIGMALQAGQQAAEVKGRDAWERSRAGTFNYGQEVLPSANYDPVVIDARKALANTQSAASTPSAQPRPAAPTPPKQKTNMPSYLPQTSRPSPDIVEPSPDELYRQKMAAGNFSGASISSEATMKERAAQQTRAAGEAQAVDSAKEIALTPEQREARRVAREAAEDKQEGYTNAKGEHVDGEKDRIHKRRQAQRDARNAREADRLRGEGVAQNNREIERDQNRRRYSRGSTTNQNRSPSVSSGGSNVRYGLGGGESIGGGGAVQGMNEGMASGIAGGLMLPFLANDKVRKGVIAATENSWNFMKKYGPLLAVPPKELAAGAMGRQAGLGFSREGAQERFNYYRKGLDTARNAAKGLIGFGANLFGLPKVGSAINKGIDVTTNLPGMAAVADETATMAGAMAWDPRLAGMNFKRG